MNKLKLKFLFFSIFALSCIVILLKFSHQRIDTPLPQIDGSASGDILIDSTFNVAKINSVQNKPIEIKSKNETEVSFSKKESEEFLDMAVANYGKKEYGPYLIEALKKDPRNIKALEKYAYLLLNSNQLAASKIQSRRCLTLDPKSISCNASLIHASSRFGDFEGSRAAAEECLLNLPESKDCLEALATYHIQKGDLDEAKVYIDILEKFATNEPFTVLTIAMYYDKAGELKIAHSAFQKVCLAIKQPYACKRMKEIETNESPTK